MAATILATQLENLEKERDEYKAALAQIKADIEWAYSPTEGPDSKAGWTNTSHRHGSAETATIYAVVCSSLAKGAAISKQD